MRAVPTVHTDPKEEAHRDVPGIVTDRGGMLIRPSVIAPTVPHVAANRVPSEPIEFSSVPIDVWSVPDRPICRRSGIRGLALPRDYAHHLRAVGHHPPFAPLP